MGEVKNRLAFYWG